METLYVVRYSHSHRNGYRNFRPTIWKVVRITGDSVWGIIVDGSTLAQVNRGGVNDGSGRSWSLDAFGSLEEAKGFAVGVGCAMDRDEDSRRLKGHLVP